MNKSVKIIVSLILILVLSISGFFIGRQFTEKVPLEEPIRTDRLTVQFEGISSAQCVDLIQNGVIANRLVENLMLQCTPDDLLMTMHVEIIDDSTIVVETPLDQDGNMVYLADELVWILEEECQTVSENVSVTITDQKTLTITYEEQPDKMMTVVLTAFGAVLGILFSLLIVLVGKQRNPDKSQAKR